MLKAKLIRLAGALSRAVPGDTPPCGAIITAAGSSTRMGGVSKQLMELDGKKTVEYSVEAFAASTYVTHIVLSVREDELENMKNLFGDSVGSKPVAYALGGATRRESVENAFFKLDKSCRLVAIHDAARPLIRTSDVDEVILAAAKYGAATAGYPAADSLKRVDEKGFVTDNVPREGVWSVQTPQVFSRDVYSAALAVARRDGLEDVTDDNTLVTHAGFSVKAVDFSNKNLKLTTPDDPENAEAILRYRRLAAEKSRKDAE